MVRRVGESSWVLSGSDLRPFSLQRKRPVDDVVSLPPLQRHRGEPEFRQLEPRGQLVAATGGHSSGSLTTDDGPTDMP
jgi:hypothetical protein